MAIDVCSEIPISLSISPRISFSHDLNQTNLLLLEDQDHDLDHRRHLDRRRLDSTSDFDFCIVTDDHFTFEISSADELFSDGKILPADIKSKEYNQQKLLDSHHQSPLTSTARVTENSNSIDHEEINVKKILQPLNSFRTSIDHSINIGPNLDEKRIKFDQESRQTLYPSNIDLEEINVEKIPKSSRLFWTSTVSNSISTRPNSDEKRIKSITESNQTPTTNIWTSTTDNSTSTGPNLDKKSNTARDKNISSSIKNNPSEKKITRLKELLSSGFDSDSDSDENDKTHRRKSFWQFRRSSSLNLEKIKSLHFISRSNSTGSVRPAGPTKPKPGLKKQQSLNSGSGRVESYYKRTASFSSGTNYYNYYNNSVTPKGIPRKNNSCGSQYSSGGRMVNPVLNLPQPYISKVTVSFFGFGSLFCNGKLGKKKK